MFLTLLRAGLWQRMSEEAWPVALSREEWAELFRMARRQTVTGIVCRGIEQLPEALQPDDGELVKWAAAVESIAQRNKQMNRALQTLVALFEREGLRPVLLKGQGVAALYVEPELRECGDIDLYFAESAEREWAARLIEARGIQTERHSDGSLFYEWQGVAVEHHTHLLDLCNPFLKKRVKALEETETLELPSAIEGRDGTTFKVTVPSATLNVLLLNTHILKHALGWGVGLRQLCDMARAYHILHGRIESETVKQLSRKAGLLRWNRLLHSCLTDDLGLLADELPYADKVVPSHPLLNKVLKTGNFGHDLRPEEASGSPSWCSRLHTARAFAANCGFSCRYAPKEAFWNIVELF